MFLESTERGVGKEKKGRKSKVKEENEKEKKERVGKKERS